MHDNDREPFPWLALLGTVVLVASIVLAAMHTGLCTSAAPC